MIRHGFGYSSKTIQYMVNSLNSNLHRLPDIFILTTNNFTQYIKLHCKATHANCRNLRSISILGRRQPQARPTIVDLRCVVGILGGPYSGMGTRGAKPSPRRG